MKLFHTNGCECSRCYKCDESPSAEHVRSPGDHPFTAFVTRREPEYNSQISGRVNIRAYTQPQFRTDVERPYDSDVWHLGKDGPHAASHSWIALTATPAAYHSVMQDDFVDVPPAPDLRSGLIRGGQSGLYVDRVNVQDTPSMAAGDMVTLTAMGKVIRG